MADDSPTNPARRRAVAFARQLIAWLATVAVVAGQAGIRADRQAGQATLLFVAGALVLAVVLRRHVRDPEPERDPPELATRRSTSTALLQLIALAGLAGGSFTLLTHWSSGFYLGWGLLLTATALYSFALAKRDTPALAMPKWSARELIALLLIFALGAWLRAHRLGEFPDGYSTHAIEEQQTGLGGYRVLHDGARPWEFFLDYQMTAAALWFDADPNFTTIRVPYVIVSALTVLVVHGLFRQLLTLPAALAATFLYAASSWNLLYSRCAHPIFPTNILVIAVLALLVRFARTRQLADLPWIGLMCGYTLYSYAGFRGTPMFAGVFLSGLLLAAALRRAPSRQITRAAAALAIFSVSLFASAAPLYRLLGHGPQSYYFEAAQRALANKEYYTEDRHAFLEQRWERIRDTAAIFMHFGDGSPTFNSPGTPMLDPVTACLATVGMFLMLLTLRRRYSLFFVFTFAVLMLVGTVFVQNLDVRRLGGITVFVALACGHCLDAVWKSVRHSRWLALPTLLLAGAAAAGVVHWSYDLYFHKMANDPNIRRAFKDHYTTLIRFGHEHGRDQPIGLFTIMHRFFDPSYHYRINYSWLIDPVLSGRTMRDVNELLPKRNGPRHPLPPTIVAQRPFEAEAIGEFLLRLYPGTSCADLSEIDNPWVGIVACDLPDPLRPAALELRLHARYWTGDRGGKPALERDEPFLGYATVPQLCYAPHLGQWCHAEWRGELEVGNDVDYQLQVETIGPTKFELWLDGLKVGQFPQPLMPGPHVVEVHAELHRDWETGVRLSWIQGGKTMVLPFYREPPKGPLADSPPAATSGAQREPPARP